MTELEEIATALGEVSPAWARARSASIDNAPRGHLQDRSHEVRRGVEAIREGWLLHRGASRIAPRASFDLALLIGDWAYAAGLVDVAERGTLDDVATLAGLVADLSTHHAEPLAALEPRWDSALDALRVES